MRTHEQADAIKRLNHLRDAIALNGRDLQYIRDRSEVQQRNSSSEEERLHIARLNALLDATINDLVKAMDLLGKRWEQLSTLRRDQ